MIPFSMNSLTSGPFDSSPLSPIPLPKCLHPTQTGRGIVPRLASILPRESTFTLTLADSTIEVLTFSVPQILQLSGEASGSLLRIMVLNT